MNEFRPTARYAVIAGLLTFGMFYFTNTWLITVCGVTATLCMLIMIINVERNSTMEKKLMDEKQDVPFVCPHCGLQVDHTHDTEQCLTRQQAIQIGQKLIDAERREQGKFDK